MNTLPFSKNGQMIELCCEYLCVRWIWLYVIMMPCSRIRVNLHSNVAWMLRNSLLESGALCCEYFFVQCIWKYVIIMSRTPFRVDPHSISRLFRARSYNDHPRYSFLMIPMRFLEFYGVWIWISTKKICTVNLLVQNKKTLSEPNSRWLLYYLILS